MDEKIIITIGRQCGSGGRRIGRMLAKRYGIDFYDKELLQRAAKESGLCEDLFMTHDEKPTSSFLYSLVMDTYSLGYTSSGYMDMPIKHKIFLAQFDTIKKIASEHSCVIVGRCADYALAGFEDMVSIFVGADDEDKIRHIMEEEEVGYDKAKEIMVKADKRRASYYNYYSSKRWSDSRSYDLCINSSRLGIEGSVDLIQRFVELKKARQKASGEQASGKAEQ